MFDKELRRLEAYEKIQKAVNAFLEGYITKDDVARQTTLAVTEAEAEPATV